MSTFTVITFLMVISLALKIKCWSTIASPEFCLENKKAVLYSEKSSHLGKFLEAMRYDELGLCTSLYYYEPLTRKVVLVESQDKGKSSYPLIYNINSTRVVGDLQTIAEGIDANDLDLKQTLVFVSYFDRSESEPVYKYLKKMQDEGWNIIVVCFIGEIEMKSCPMKPWLPINRVIPYNINLTPDYFTSLIDVIKNPSYDRVERSKRIEFDNFNRSCFNQDIVVHIIFSSDHIYYENVMIVALQSKKKVKFVFHLANVFDLKSIDEEFLNFAFQKHGIDTISFGETYDTEKLKATMKVDSHRPQTKHIFISDYLKHQDSIVENEKIHYIDYLDDEEYFFNTINELVCQKTLVDRQNAEL